MGIYGGFKMYKILALDQASRQSGYSIFKDNELIKFGTIKLEDENVGARLVQLRQSIKFLIAENQIDYVVFEDIQMQTSVGNNVKTFKVLANVFGVILELCEELKIKYDIVSSNTWKSTLKIKGRNRAEQKKNAQLFVEETYGVHCTQDEADAICIGTHAYNTIGYYWG